MEDSEKLSEKKGGLFHLAVEEFFFIVKSFQAWFVDRRDFLD